MVIKVLLWLLPEVLAEQHHLNLFELAKHLEVSDESTLSGKEAPVDQIVN